ncbi:hypothetical protein IJ674_04475 [bacterium]|nr:hypothetical protein [bacterium]
MQKQIHVNSYVKRDGTQVKEHLRTIDTDYYVTAPVLQGGVSVDVGFPTGSGAGDVGAGAGLGNILSDVSSILGTVAAVGSELAPIALQMYQAINNGNGQAVEYLRPQFDTKMKQLDTRVAQMKTNIDNNIAKLVNTKNRTEYSKIYEPLQKDWQAYQSAKNIVNRIKVHANNEDFQSIANELGNFMSESPIGKTIITNPLMQNVITNLQKNFYNPNGMTFEEQVVDNLTKAGSKMMPVAGANLQNAMHDFSYAKDNPHAYILNSRTEITNQGLSKLMEQVGIPENSRGVIYDNNSEQSQILWQSPEIQNFVKNNLQDLISDNAKEGYDIEFQSSGDYTGHRFDNYLGLQHCKLYNPQITFEGYFKGIVVDYYDFVKRIINSLGSYLNNWGYSMQEKGLLENIFNIYIIYEKL